MKKIIAGVGLSLIAVAVHAQIKVTGQVVAPGSGDPVAGITIQAEHFQSRHSGKPSDFQQQATSGPDGRFEMRLPQAAEEQYTVFITDAQGRILDAYGHVSEDLDFGSVVQQNNYTLAGAVFTEDAGKARGVPVKLEIRLKKFTCTHHIPAGETVTDADGNFRFENLAPGQYQCQVSSPAYVPAASTLEVSDGLNYMEFVLEKGASVRGRVLGPDSEPLAGIIVRSGRDNATVSGEDGSYLLSGFGAERQRLEIESEDYALPDGSSMTVQTRKGETLETDIRLIRAGTIVLTLTSEVENVLPPARIRASLSASRTSSRRSSLYLYRSAEVTDGKARLTGIPPSTFTISVSGQGLPDLSETVTVTGGETTELELSIPWSCSVTGRVTNAAGTPLEEASISFSPVQDEETDSVPTDAAAVMRRAMQRSLAFGTDEDGRFRASGLTAGQFTMEITHPQYQTREETITIAEDSEWPDTFVLEAGLTISGVIADADGVPVVGAIIRARKPQDRSSRYSGRSEKRAESDTNGVFVVSGLSTGAYSLVVSDPEDEEQLASLDDVTAGSDLVTFAIARLRTIEITVTLPDGQPAAGAALSWDKIEDPDRQSFYSRWTDSDQTNLTGADGRFSTKIREGAHYRFAATLAGYLPGTKNVDLQTLGSDTDTHRVEIALQQGCTVRGVVLSSRTGNPIQDAIVSVGAATRFRRGVGPDDESAVRTDAAGRFELTGVPAGVVTVSVSREVEAGESRPLGSRQVRARQGKPVETEIRIENGGTVRIAAFDATGNPVANSHFMLYSPTAGSSPYQAETDKDGIVLIKDIPPGDYFAMRFDPETGTDRSSAPRAFSIIADETTALDFRDKPAVDERAPALSGTVTRDGAPFGESLTFLPLKEEFDMMKVMALYSGKSRVELDANGAFSDLRLEPGRYLYSVSAPGASASTRYIGEVEIVKDRTEYALIIGGTHLSGTVRDTDRKPVSEAELYLMGEEWPSVAYYFMARQTTTDQNGDYKTEALPPGTYTLFVMSGNEMTIRKGLQIAAEPDAQRFDITLDPAFSLTGAIAMPDVDTLDGAVVMLADVESGQPRSYAAVGPDGSFKMEPALSAGDYLALATRDGYAVEVRVLTLDASSVFNATLVPAGKIAVTVKGGADWNPQGARLTIVNERGETIVRLKQSGYEFASPPMSLVNVRPLDNQGRSEISGLLPGTYTIGVEGQPFTATAEVNALETTRVVLQP